MMEAAVKEPFCAGSWTVGGRIAAGTSDGFFSWGFGMSFFVSFLDSLMGGVGIGLSTSGGALGFSFSTGDSGRL